jgi:hypothetical protein
MCTGNKNARECIYDAFDEHLLLVSIINHASRFSKKCGQFKTKNYAPESENPEESAGK